MKGTVQHPWPFSKSKLNLKPDRVNLIATASPIECLLNLPNVRAIQYKLGPERLTQLGNSNVLRLSVCKRNYKWSSVQRWQCPIQYGTIKSSVYNFKNDYFYCDFSTKVTIVILLEIMRTKHIENYNIFHIIDQQKVSRVLL